MAEVADRPLRETKPKIVSVEDRYGVVRDVVSYNRTYNPSTGVTSHRTVERRSSVVVQDKRFSRVASRTYDEMPNGEFVKTLVVPLTGRDTLPYESILREVGQ